MVLRLIHERRRINLIRRPKARIFHARLGRPAFPADLEGILVALMALSTFPHMQLRSPKLFRFRFNHPATDAGELALTLVSKPRQHSAEVEDIIQAGYPEEVENFRIQAFQENLSATADPFLAQGQEHGQSVGSEKGNIGKIEIKVARGQGFQEGKNLLPDGGGGFLVEVNALAIKADRGLVARRFNLQTPGIL
jgi:hypothetical protein